LEAVGLVVGKNESGIHLWVAVTPLWAEIEDIEKVMGAVIGFDCTA